MAKMLTIDDYCDDDDDDEENSNHDDDLVTERRAESISSARATNLPSSEKIL